MSFCLSIWWVVCISCLCLYVCLLISLTTYYSVYVYVLLSIVCLTAYLLINQSVSLSVFLSVRVFFCASPCQSVSVCQCVCVSVLSSRPCVCVSVYQSCLPVRVSVCLCVALLGQSLISPCSSLLSWPGIRMCLSGDPSQPITQPPIDS